MIKDQVFKLLFRNLHLNIIRLPILCEAAVTTPLRCIYRPKFLKRRHKYSLLPLRIQGREAHLEIKLVVSRASFNWFKTRSLSLVSQHLSNQGQSHDTIHLSLPRTSRPFSSSDSIQYRHSYLPHHSSKQ